MNILYLQTKRKSWIWDFLILTIELMVSCLPKRLRFILEPTNQSSLINQKYNIVEKQSGDLNYEPENSTAVGGGATEGVRSISQIFD
ncbi:MAG: hypothetical protein ABSE95_05930 [Thermodesulfobacteriota bacterium]